MSSTSRQSLLLTDIGELATPEGNKAKTGSAMGRIRVVPDASILIQDGRISWAGPRRETPVLPPGTGTLSAEGRGVVPGFVDSHTHFVFSGFREDEFLWRAAGTPYMEIHRRGGGIQRTVEATRSASLEDLILLGRRRLATMLALGVTTVEGKSGYGLDRDTELRQLEAIKVLAKDQPVRVVSTFLGPHSIPPEFLGRPSDYLDFILKDVLPKVGKLGLARFCDIFCEKGVFSVEDSRRYLEAAKAAGFGIKIHADEIERTGGAALASKLGAVSADHLLKSSQEDFAALAEAGVVATCLPLTAFTLKEPYANARGMIKAGCAVALASDLNPGSCYSQSIPLIFALAVLYMGLSMEETLTALTLNGAAALGLQDTVGSLEPGKEADILILDAPSYRHLAYHTGMNLVKTVISGGKIVHEK